MLVDTKEQKRFPPLLHSLFPCKFCKIFLLYRMVALSRGCKSPCQHIYVWDLSLYAKLRHPLDFWLTDKIPRVSLVVLDTVLGELLCCHFSKCLVEKAVLSLGCENVVTLNL